MRILVISQYFWPETFRVNDVVKFLRDNNHHVDILTGTPNYPEGKLFDEYKLNKKKFQNYYGATVFRVPVFLRRDGRQIFLFFNYIAFIFSSEADISAYHNIGGGIIAAVIPFASVTRYSSSAIKSDDATLKSTSHCLSVTSQ